jgi:hypothetical protein
VHRNAYLEWANHCRLGRKIPMKEKGAQSNLAFALTVTRTKKKMEKLYGD